MTARNTLSFVLCLLLAPVSGLAQTFDLAEASNTSCGRTNVSVDAISIPDTAGFDFEIAYDAAVVNPYSVALGSLTTACDFAANLTVSGIVSISIACLNPVSGSGSVAVLTFDAVQPGSSALAFQSCQRDETNCVAPSGGSLTLSGCPTVALSPSNIGALPATGPSVSGRACVGATLVSGTAPVAEVSVDIGYPAGSFSFDSCAIGQALIDIGKGVSTSVVSSGVTRVTVSGGGAAIPNGGVFVCTLLVPSTTAYGNYTITSTPIAADASDVPIGASGAGSVVKVTNCNGDCDGSGGVTLGEVQRGLNEYGGIPLCNPTSPNLSCPATDTNTSGGVTLAEVQQALNRFSSGCPSLP